MEERQVYFISRAKCIRDQESEARFLSISGIRQASEQLFNFNREGIYFDSCLSFRCSNEDETAAILMDNRVEKIKKIRIPWLRELICFLDSNCPELTVAQLFFTDSKESNIIRQNFCFDCLRAIKKNLSGTPLGTGNILVTGHANLINALCYFANTREAAILFCKSIGPCQGFYYKVNEENFHSLSPLSDLRVKNSLQKC